MTPAFGPRIEGDQVRFRLWAPDVAQVSLLIMGAPPTPMERRSDGWFEGLVAGGAGLRYRFQAGETVFPDPASRRQEGGVHGWSIVTAPTRAPAWVGRPWHETVLYECHARLMGGFLGIAARLPELAALGVTALELMPIGAFPGLRNWGYDGVLPYAVAEACGTREELQQMLAQAHTLGISVLLDVVYNHFGPDGNYLPLYAAAFFRNDIQTPWGPAIDFRTPEVRKFFADNARHWLFEVGFDGLRFDAVHAMADDGWLDKLAGELKFEAEGSPVHLVLENEKNQAFRLREGFDAQWNDDIHHALHVMLTGETNAYYKDFADRPAALLAKGLAEGFIYQGQSSPNNNGAFRGEVSTDLRVTAFIDFLQNHDQVGNRALGERLTSLCGPRGLKAAIALQLLCPHIPLLFMGEEEGSHSPFLYFTDHGPELANAVREGRKREFAEFQALDGLTLPDPNAAESFDAANPWRKVDDGQHWRNFYCQLLQLRRDIIMPRLVGAHSLGAEAVNEKAVVARWRMGDGACLTLACNLGKNPVDTRLPDTTPFFGVSSDILAPTTTLAWLAS